MAGKNKRSAAESLDARRQTESYICTTSWPFIFLGEKCTSWRRKGTSSRTRHRTHLLPISHWLHLTSLRSEQRHKRQRRGERTLCKIPTMADCWLLGRRRWKQHVRELAIVLINSCLPLVWGLSAHEDSFKTAIDQVYHWFPMLVLMSPFFVFYSQWTATKVRREPGH